MLKDLDSLDDTLKVAIFYAVCGFALGLIACWFV